MCYHALFSSGMFFFFYIKYILIAFIISVKQGHGRAQMSKESTDIFRQEEKAMPD